MQLNVTTRNKILPKSNKNDQYDMMSESYNRLFNYVTHVDDMRKRGSDKNTNYFEKFFIGVDKLI